MVGELQLVFVTVTALIASGCDEGGPARATVGRPVTAVDATVVDVSLGDSPMGVDSSDGAGIPIHYSVCPDAMAATFPSILTQMFATASCGVNNAFDCHSTTGALPRKDGGTGSLLDFSLDAAAVYAELLGDGAGSPSVNIDGDAGAEILRVAAGDAEASLLYIKLALPTATDPRYGKAMPPTGLVCPPALDAVKAWIDLGAAGPP